MDRIKSLVECFQSNPSLKVFENFNEVLVSVNITHLKIPNRAEIIEVTEAFSERDKLIIDIIFEELDPITYYSKENPEQFISEIRKLFPLMDDGSSIQLKIKVEKTTNSNNEVSIYYFEDFTEYLTQLNLEGSMYSFKGILADREYVKFNLINVTKDVCFGTNTFIFYSQGESLIREDFQRKKIIEGRNTIGNFNNASDYSFIPEDFNLISRSNNENFNQFFDKLCTLYSVIFVSDFSSISDNKVYVKLNGYKLIETDLPFHCLNVKEIKTFYDIYRWIYIGGNLSDKAGLARNIISIHAKLINQLLIIPENTINSIKSGYDIYLKENVAQYIEVKNKVSEFLLDLALRTSDLVNSFANALRNNHFLFLTFFMSVFVFNTLSTGKLKDIFNKDITYLSYGLLLISFIYLLATIIQTNIETNRFKMQYNRLKKMYDDILNAQDINNIFKDEDHKQDIKFIEQKSTVYSFVWFIEIVILYSVILYLRV